jgi:DNA polymerase III alpha subunit (gram-positive type)
LIAHNAIFDVGFFNSSYKKFVNEKETSILKDDSVFCTMRFFKHWHTNTHSFDLDSLCHFFGINNSRLHFDGNVVHDALSIYFFNCLFFFLIFLS